MQRSAVSLVMYTHIYAAPQTALQRSMQRSAMSLVSAYLKHMHARGLRRTRLRCNDPSDAPAKTQRLCILLARYWLYY